MTADDHRELTDEILLSSAVAIATIAVLFIAYNFFYLPLQTIVHERNELVASDRDTEFYLSHYTFADEVMKLHYCRSVEQLGNLHRLKRSGEHREQTKRPSDSEQYFANNAPAD
ncbi:hypothetical protein BOX15_Mlig020118g1 [Macrostomum lignano]|uniref:Uncharacterized protein n=1 Tax=Macrostomum lignano TaxID=282301 RepID=A0A267G8F0_9PLAT|nr:hypothetical protein BOX15_Mlig020118g1 [Macrostomum lignano]